MEIRAFSRTDWDKDLAQDTDNITEYIINVDNLERKIEEEFMNGRLVLFQTIGLSAIYDGGMKSIIDNGGFRTIWVDAKLPESGAWRTILHGAIDFSTLEIDKTNKTATFDILDKLAYITSLPIKDFRNKNLDLYSSIKKIDDGGDTASLDYANGDRLVITTDGISGGVKLFGENGGNLFDLDTSSSPFVGGEVFVYQNNRYTKRLFVLKASGGNIEDAEGDTFYCFNLETYGVKAKNEDFPVGVCCGIVGSAILPDENHYSNKIFGKDVYIRDANKKITGIDGASLLEAVMLRVDTSSSVIKNNVPDCDIGVKDWYNLTFGEPEDARGYIKDVAKRCNASIFTGKDFDIVLQKRFNFLGGNTKSYEDWHAKETNFKHSAFEIIRRYIVKVDGNDGVEVTRVVDNVWFKTGKVEHLELSYPGVSKDETTLNNYADNYAGILLSFYGERHQSYEAVIYLLKDSYFDFELYDHVGDYFITRIEYNIKKDSVKLTLLERDGHTS